MAISHRTFLTIATVFLWVGCAGFMAALFFSDVGLFLASLVLMVTAFVLGEFSRKQIRGKRR